jgi:muramidase (phage lysozyme)
MALGDGQVMDRVRSFLTEPTFANVEGMAPEDVARRRALAEALWAQGNSSRPVVGVFDGMNRVLQSFLGGRQLRQSENADIFLRDRAEAEADAEAARIEQQQVAGLNRMIDFGYSNQQGAPAGPVMTPGAPGFDGGTAMRAARTAADAPPSPFVGTGVASQNLDPVSTALLNAIAAPESDGRYNLIYGGSTFDDYSQHPNRMIPISSGPNVGLNSSAAGRYQFIGTTWNEAANALGLTDFSPESQDKAALWLANRDYRSRTGRDLMSDLATNGMTPQIAAALAPTWEGLGVNPREAMAAYSDTLAGRPPTGITPGAASPAATPTADPTAQFLRDLAANPATRPFAVEIIQDQIARLTTPPAPVDPITVAQGTDVIDPRTGRLIYSNDPAPENGTAGMQEYNLYLAQLPAGQTPLDFTAWDNQRRRAGAPNYFENAYNRVTGEQDAKLRGDINDAETNAFAQLNSYDAMEQLMNDPNFYSGVMADQVAGLRRFFGAIGLADPQSAVAIENFGALANEAVLKALGGSLGAQISNTDRTFLQQTVPNLTFSEEGNRTLLAIQRAVAQRQIQVAQMARDYALANGGIDDGFRQQIAQWREANPLFPQGSVPGISAAPPPAAAPFGAPATPPPAGGIIYQSPNITIRPAG